MTPEQGLDAETDRQLRSDVGQDLPLVLLCHRH